MKYFISALPIILMAGCNPTNAKEPDEIVLKEPDQQVVIVDQAESKQELKRAQEAYEAEKAVETAEPEKEDKSLRDRLRSYFCENDEEKEQVAKAGSEEKQQ